MHAGHSGTSTPLLPQKRMRNNGAILTALLLLLPFSTEAASPTLYELMRDASRTELMFNTDDRIEVEGTVKNFVSHITKATDAFIVPNDIDLAFRRDYQRLCGSHPEARKDAGNCAVFAETLRDEARAEELTRALGRDLQIIASGYEMQVDGYPGRQTNLPTRYLSLLALWRAGTGGQVLAQTGLLIRYEPMPEGLEATFATLASALDTLEKPDEFTAAVWRYQHGYRLVRGDREEEGFPPPEILESGPGAERQYLAKRWESVEAALEALDTVLLSTEIDPPLRDKEIVFFSVPPMYQDLLPANVIVWAYFEQHGEEFEGDTSGDVGLQWRIPLEPVKPALLANPEDTCAGATPGDHGGECPGIPGGRYPPPPEKEEENGERVPMDGRGLCTMPFARLGYLCRPILTAKGTCPEPQDPPPDKILLTRCQMDPAGTRTNRGPDICQSFGYRIPANDGAPPIPEGEQPDEICTPNRETWYVNSIGNHMCYIGQCIEQSMESRRLIAGRSPFTVQDEAFPWDSCEGRDPLFAILLTPPPASGTSSFPDYRPALLIKNLDLALCQMNGLPPQTPPVLCSFDARRRLHLPTELTFLTASGLTDQSTELAQAVLGLQRLSDGLGARIGTTLFQRYLRRSVRPFEEITTIAAELLENLTKITFARDMCPRNAAEENALKDHEKCLPPEVP